MKNALSCYPLAMTALIAGIVCCTGMAWGNGQLPKKEFCVRNFLEKPLIKGSEDLRLRMEVWDTEHKRRIGPVIFPRETKCMDITGIAVNYLEVHYAVSSSEWERLDYTRGYIKESCDYEICVYHEGCIEGRRYKCE